MKKTVLSIMAITGLSLASTSAMAQYEVGLMGERNSDKINVDALDQTASVKGKINTFGAYFQDHNLYTQNESGFIYRFSSKWSTGDEGYSEVTNYDIGGDAGYRFVMNQHFAIDLIGGVGYQNFKLDSELNTLDGRIKEEDKMDQFYVRYGVAGNVNLNQDHSLRLEVGGRYLANGDMDIKIDVPNNSPIASGKYSASLENKNSFYAEGSWMIESTPMPMRVSVFHERSNFNSDTTEVKANFKQKTTGLKVGILF